LASLKVVLFVVFTLALFVSYLFEKLQPENLSPESIQNDSVGKDASSLNTETDAKRIVINGSKTDSDLFSFVLSSGQKIAQITNETSDELMPVYANTSDTVAYLSDLSGKTQIWILDAQGQSSKISDSPASLGLTPLKWSPDDRFIVFEYQREIFLLDVNSHSIERIVDNSHRASVPNWSWSGDSVFYSSQKNGEWQIWRYFLSSGKHLQVTFEGGYSANQHQNGDLYFSKIHQSGIWKLVPDKSSKYGFSTQMKVFDDFDQTNWLSWQLQGNDLYFISAEEKEKGLIRYNLRTKTRQFIFPFDEKYLPYFSVKGDRAVFTILENRENNIEIPDRVE